MSSPRYSATEHLSLALLGTRNGPKRKVIPSASSGHVAGISAKTEVESGEETGAQGQEKGEGLTR